MGKNFERALILSPSKYSFSNSFREIMAEIAGEVRSFDPGAAIGKRDLKINSQAFRLPYFARKHWDSWFQQKANRMLLSVVEDYKPDIILVYNSVFLLPETCSLMKKRSRLLFFMGDSPFYTPQNNYYLACLPYADLIMSPDSFWSRQLNTIGLSRTIHFLPGPDAGSYFRLENPADDPEVPVTEILYVGSNYLNSWGYKKALLMSSFTGFNFRIYGNSAWRRWFEFFPALEPLFTECGFIAQEKLNRMFNLTRLVPVDGNPGILNGVHLRLFEALGAGALPLVEYRDDLENRVFKGFSGELPLIRDYGKAADLASYYLKNEAERSALVTSMYDFLAAEYSHVANACRIAEALKL